jgi:kynurenine formamidase
LNDFTKYADKYGDMIATVNHKGKELKVDLNKGMDISMPITTDPKATRAWYIDEPKMEPVVLGDWIGDVNKGSGVNFYDIQFNPHAHGTHTETAGHVLNKRYSINQHLQEYFFVTELISVRPAIVGENEEITLDLLKAAKQQSHDALIIRTLPNEETKLKTNYSNSNPPYITVEGINWLREQGVKHLLIDLPSVDPEKDGGAVAAHHAFWHTEGEIRLDCTITELVYVPDEIEDGEYFMNLQVAAFENDAAPSRPVLFEFE